MIYSELNITNVFLILGDECNFSCRHCVQEPYHEVKKIELKEPSDKVLQYLNHLYSIRSVKDEKIFLKFWGGEPLLYMDTIRKVVEKLGNRFNYSITTNGLLLTDEIVEYCNEKKIHVTLSNDGPETSCIRRLNVLDIDDIRERFMKLNLKSLNCIVTAHSQDYFKIWDYFENKCPGVYVNFEPLLYNWEFPEDLYQFDVNGYKNTMDLISEKAFEATIDGVMNKELYLIQNIVNKVVGIVKKIKNGVVEEVKAFPCMQVRQVMNIDLDGNVYSCHNNKKLIGTVEDHYLDLIDSYDNSVSITDTCKQCEFFTLCGGGCPLELDNKNKQQLCEIRKIFYNTAIEYIKMFKDYEYDYTKLEVKENLT